MLRKSTTRLGSIESIRIAQPFSNPFSIIRSCSPYRPVLVMLGQFILNEEVNTRLCLTPRKIDYEISVDLGIKNKSKSRKKYSHGLSRSFAFLFAINSAWKSVCKYPASVKTFLWKANSVLLRISWDKLSIDGTNFMPRRRFLLTAVFLSLCKKYLRDRLT